jgi:hypothetical protein
MMSKSPITTILNPEHNNQSINSPNNQQNQSANQSIEPSNWQRISNLAKLIVQKSAKIKNLICVTH